MTFLSCYSFDKWTFSPIVQLLRIEQNKLISLSSFSNAYEQPLWKKCLTLLVLLLSALLKKISYKTSYIHVWFAFHFEPKII